MRVSQEALFQEDVSRFSAQCEKDAATTEVTATYSKVTLIVAPNHLPFVAQLPIPAVERARVEGAEIVSLVKGLYPSDPDLTPASRLLRDAILGPYFFRSDTPQFEASPEWIIDPSQNNFTYRGTNYYSGLHNSLGIIFRRFRLDFEDELVATQVRRHLIMFQTAHDIFAEFLSATDPDRTYRFVVIGIQYGLGFALRTLINAANCSNISVVHASNGYEAFDREWRRDPDGNNFIPSYHSIRDLTFRPDTPLSFRPTPKDCEHTLFPNESDYKDHAITESYVRKVSTREASAQKSYIKRSSAKRRVLVLGTILPDLSIPHDRGYVHDDIADWIFDTTRIAGLSENLTVLIKQHPAELDHKIGFYVAEKFVDLIPSGSRNVEILPYSASFHEAVADCDAVVLWSGTSSVELALIGKDYVACSRYAQEEYPLHADQPVSRKDYEDILLGRRSIVTRADARLRAIDVIYRTSSSPVRELSKWPKRQLLNAQVWPVQIDPNMAGQLMADPSIMRQAERLTRPE